MTSITSTSKVVAVAAALAMFASMSFAVAPAHAQTAAELQAQISSLLATIQSLQAQLNGTQGAAVQYNTDLTVGSTGADVTSLQQFLVAQKFLQMPVNVSYGYFGAITKAALAAYQAANGISPAVGYFGPITRAKVNAAGGSMTTGGSTSTGSLSGSGRLTNVSSLGDVSTDLHEGDSSTKVVGVQADATDGDVAIQRLDVTLDIEGSGSTNLNKYVSDVSVYLGSTKLASMDPADGDKSTGGVWSYRFSGLNAVIKSGQTGNLYVKVTPIDSVGSSEAAGSVIATLAVGSLRAAGADGISDTYISGSAITSTFTVHAATTGTLTVTAAGDNPTASQVAVSSSTTTGVKLLSFNMKAKNSDITITDLAASLGTTNDHLNDVVNTVYLMKGSTVLKSKTVSTGTYQVITFSDINQTISKDDTEAYSIVVDLKGDAAYADGVTLVASTTSGTSWDIEDANGDAITSIAAAVGNTQTLTASGISVVKGTATATVNAANYTGGVDTATFTLPFTVTAGDNDVFISGDATNGTETGSGIRYGTTTTSTIGATGAPSANLSAGSVVTGDSAGTYYKVLAGTSRTFTLNVSLVASTTGVTAGYVGVQLNSIAYGATSGALSSYYTSNLDTFKTNDVYVQKH